jgi:hypothetical protein
MAAVLPFAAAVTPRCEDSPSVITSKELAELEQIQSVIYYLTRVLKAKKADIRTRRARGAVDQLSAQSSAAV